VLPAEENLDYKIIPRRKLASYGDFGFLNILYSMPVCSDVRVPITEYEAFYKAGILAPGCLDSKLKPGEGIPLKFLSESSNDRVVFTNIRLRVSSWGNFYFQFDRMKSPPMTVDDFDSNDI